MAIDWGAALAGGASEILEAWKTRDEQEAKLSYAEKLEQLRRETADYEFTRNKEDAKKKVKDTRFDPLSGETAEFNEYGEEIGRKKDQASVDKYAQDKMKFELDVRNTEDQIKARNRGLELEAARLGESRADRAQRERLSKAERDAADGGGSGATYFGRQLFGANKTVVDAAIKDGIPAEYLDRLSVEAAARAKANGGGLNDAQRIFLDGITALRGGTLDGKWDQTSYDESRGRGKKKK